MGLVRRDIPDGLKYSKLTSHTILPEVDADEHLTAQSGPVRPFGESPRLLPWGVTDVQQQIGSRPGVTAHTPE